MFKRTQPVTDPVTIYFGDKDIVAQRGEPVAAALLASGVHVFRTSPLSNSPRAPLCMIGNCFECLLEIDGEPNRQACRARVRDGMHVREQQGVRVLEENDED